MKYLIIITLLLTSCSTHLDYDSLWSTAQDIYNCHDVAQPRVYWFDGLEPSIAGVYIPQSHTILLNPEHVDYRVILHEYHHACGYDGGEVRKPLIGGLMDIKQVMEYKNINYDGLPFKPLFGQPCNHCGLCCRMELCPVAKIMFEKEGCVQPPCPALFMKDKKALCGIVIGEVVSIPAKQLISNALGIGCGCSMADASTTKEQIKEHDEKAMRLTNGAIKVRQSED